MSGPLVLKQNMVGDTILSDYSFMDNEEKISDFMTKENFLSLSEDDAQVFFSSLTVKSIDEVKKIWPLMTREEIYELLSKPNLKSEIDHVLDSHNVLDALKYSIDAGQKFVPSSVVNATSNDINSWKTSSPVELPTIDNSDEYDITYIFNYKNNKSLFLALVFAVPELLNQLVINFYHVDNEMETSFVKTEQIDKYVQELKNLFQDNTSTDQQVIDIIATLMFIVSGKLIENMHEIFETLATEVSDTRAVVISFMLEVAGIGLMVNEQVWGRDDNIVNGTSIILDTSNNILKVVNSRAFVTKYSELTKFDSWVPSSFYYKYNIHARPEKTLKTKKEFWERVVYDGYDTSKSARNFVKYIKSRIR